MEAEITPFFASIHGYVSLAEQLTPTQLREVMNAYFDACVTEIQSEGGTLDKFIGDTVVAMFGAPERVRDHALRACMAALKGQSQVALLRERWQREERKWPELAQHLRMRIGLHTGSVIVGNLGNAQRFNYTMIGDNVNLAARMESGAKAWGVWTLCTEATKSACEQEKAGRIFFRPLGKIVVKGRVDLLGLYEPMALAEDVTARMRECVGVFEAGLARWREQDREGALKCFIESARLEEHQPGLEPGVASNPSLTFVREVELLRANPAARSMIF